MEKITCFSRQLLKFFFKNMSFEILSQFIFSLVPLVKILLTFAVYGLY